MSVSVDSTETKLQGEGRSVGEQRNAVIAISTLV